MMILLDFLSLQGGFGMGKNGQPINVKTKKGTRRRVEMTIQKARWDKNTTIIITLFYKKTK